jgi:UDP-N-acetylmuramyl pentapeptide phosphotransferase/UDP-N-acetylglucosamine-1-phosphate transferase
MECDVESPSERKDIHERGMKLAGGYLAFVAALLVAAVAKSNDYRLAWVVISLLALSLPSLVALILIDFVVPVRQGKPTNAMRGLAFGLGFSPSVAALAVLVGHFSVIAAALFVLLTLYWSLTIFAVAIGGTSDAKSESDIQRDQ